MSTIADALRRIKGNLDRYLPPALLDRLGRGLGRPCRRRTLTPAVTASLFLRQVLHGNPACTELRHRAGIDFTESAYCQARARLPVAFFHRLQQAVGDRCAGDDHPRGRWKGHRLFLLDGSSFSMPDAPELRETFGQPGAQAEGCGFPVAHLLALFDGYRGYLLRAIPAPCRTHDLAHAALTHDALGPGDLLVGDRALCSYAHLALCRRRRLHGLFRAHQRRVVDFRPGRPHNGPGRGGPAGRPRSRWLRRLGRHDQLVEYFKPKERPSWLSAEEYGRLPASLVVREVRVKVAVPGQRTAVLTLVTTLLDPKRYPARALAKLYGRRWQAETDLRHLKQTLGLDVLRCRSVPGVVKELKVFAVAYNLVRRVMAEAARRQQVVPDRISFADALGWLRHARAGDPLPRLKVNPVRPGRVEPRAKKRRDKQFDLLRKPRAELRKALFRKKPAA